jgi:hypothetical protein
MRAVIALACAAGCYKPSIVNCQYSCATGEVCPGGFVCDLGNCVGAIGQACGELPDGGTPSELIGEAGCGFGYPVSNVNPCQFSGITGDWLVLTNHTTTIDTNLGTITGDAPPIGSIHSAQLSNFTDAMVVYVGQFDLGRDATFIVHGSSPLIILADTRVSIDGVIDFSVAVNGCATSGAGKQGASVGGTGGGGGGGSLGIVPIFSNGAGAAGGNGGGGAAGGAAGVPLADTGLDPLVTGCPGGEGGEDGSGGGRGGGAIQISTRGTFDLLGQLRANGGGGISSGLIVSGAGGGGSGGAILVEATTTTLQAGSKLCANGGGGGAADGTATPAQDGQCSNAVAHGAGTSGNPGSGGDGESISFDAIPGQPGGASQGGGGGGGGVGIIRVNGTFDNQGATTSPNVTQ